MKTVKKYKYILAAVVLLAAVVMVRAFHPGIFRYDAVKWAEKSVDGENIVTPDRVSSLSDNILFVRLDAGCKVPDIAGAAILSSDPGDLLKGDNLRQIRRNRGPVIICSGDMSVSARVWMVLSETGIRQLYILKKDPA